MDEKERKYRIMSCPYVHNVYIDCFEDGLNSLKKIRPEIICLGYDQNTVWEDYLIEMVKNQNPNVQIHRLNKYARGIHTRHILHKRHSKLYRHISKKQKKVKILAKV